MGFLFAQINQNHQFQVRFKWEPNDIAIWDNRVRPYLSFINKTHEIPPYTGRSQHTPPRSTFGPRRVMLCALRRTASVQSPSQITTARPGNEQAIVSWSYGRNRGLYLQSGGSCQCVDTMTEAFVTTTWVVMCDTLLY